MLKQAFTKVFGTRFHREMKRIRPVIERIHDIEADLAAVVEAADEEAAHRLRLRIQRLEETRSERQAELEGIP